MPNLQLERDIWESVTVNGRYESDVYNDFLLRSPHRRIARALDWLVERGHLRRCGDRARPLYARPERTYRYTNILPIPDKGVLADLMKMGIEVNRYFLGECNERKQS